jgi:hypothetical protein
VIAPASLGSPSPGRIAVAGGRSRHTGCGTSIRLCPGQSGSGRSARPPFRPHRHPVDACPGPIQQLRVGELVEDELVQPVPHAGVLPLAQPSPRGVSGSAPQLLGQARQRQPVSRTNKIPSSAARSSIRGRPPGPRGAGRGGIKGSISSQSRSSTKRCCMLLATTGDDQRSAAQHHATTHLVLRPGLNAETVQHGALMHAS